MEAEVLKALLVGRIPTILFVMNRFSDVNNIQIEQALKEHRLLIVVLKRNEPRRKGLTPRLRNEYVLSLCQHVVCGYVNKNGSVFPLLAGRIDVEKLIDDKAMQTVAEPDTCRERWTLAQDKMLLRMYYEDMGIHAIHKKLNRSYLAVYTRLRAITQPEEVLKGREFEDYVLGLFNLQENGTLVLQEWQGDKSLGMIQPENNAYPDFVFRYGQETFAVECKWREKLCADLSKDLFPQRIIKSYTTFSEERNIPVTIALGVGGEPCNPEKLYIIPLEEIPKIIKRVQERDSFLNSIDSIDIARLLRKGRTRNI